MINYGLHILAGDEVLPPGTYSIITEARLPRGTSPETYRLSVLPTSEFLLEDGAVIAPRLDGDAELVVEHEVAEGWDGGLPPLSFNDTRKGVLGKVEFRASDVEGFPGDTVDVRVQMRSEVPLNHVMFLCYWEMRKLYCEPEGFADILFANPEDQFAYESPNLPVVCANGGISCVAAVQGRFQLRGSMTGAMRHHGERPLEYFRPLGEWVDLVGFSLRIPEGAGGGSEVPLRSERIPEEVYGVGAMPAFEPYGADWPWPCSALGTEGINWAYDVSYHDGKVKVLGDQEPIPEPVEDLGILWVVGDAVGSPGDVVDVGLWTALEKPPVGILWLVLEVDPEVLVLESAVFDILWPHSGELESGEVVREEGRYSSNYKRCDDPLDRSTCVYGVPWHLHFWPSDERYAVLEVAPGPSGSDYPGEALRQIGALKVRIQEGTTAQEARILPGEAPPDFTPFRGAAQSGAFISTSFFPAREVRGGAVRIVATEFVRGDSNADGEINVADAVVTSLHLFSGREAPPCLDAADADDNGELGITDPIALLGSLFLGGGDLPAPYPRCGEDGTNDEFICRMSSCPRLDDVAEGP